MITLQDKIMKYLAEQMVNGNHDAEQQAKEYIELCKNKKIQGLRPELNYGDWYIADEQEEYRVYTGRLFSRYDWLPTSGQLDEEIVKFCTNNYWYNLNYDTGGYSAEYGRDDITDYRFVTINPLIAKIKLLIKLLESEI